MGNASSNSKGSQPACHRSLLGAQQPCRPLPCPCCWPAPGWLLPLQLAPLPPQASWGCLPGGVGLVGVGRGTFAAAAAGGDAGAQLPPSLTSSAPPLPLGAGGRALLDAGGDLLESAALAWRSTLPGANSSRPLPAAAATAPPPPGNTVAVLGRLTGSPAPAAPSGSQAAVLETPVSLDGSMPPMTGSNAEPAAADGAAPQPEGGPASTTPAQFATQAALVLTKGNDTAGQDVAEAAALAFAAGQPAAAVAFAQVGGCWCWVLGGGPFAPPAAVPFCSSWMHRPAACLAAPPHSPWHHQ